MSEELINKVNSRKKAVCYWCEKELYDEKDVVKVLREHLKAEHPNRYTKKDGDKAK